MHLRNVIKNKNQVMLSISFFSILMRKYQISFQFMKDYQRTSISLNYYNTEDSGIIS